jgi:hypothetical protein
MHRGQPSFSNRGRPRTPQSEYAQRLVCGLTSAKSADETLPSTDFRVGQRFRQNEHHCRPRLQADLHRLPGESDRGGGNSAVLTAITTLVWPNGAKAFRLNIPLNNLSFAYAKTNSLNMFVGNPGWIRYFCVADSGVLRQIPEYYGGIRKTFWYGRLSPPDAAQKLN